MDYKILLYKDKKPKPGEPPGDWPAFMNPMKEGEVIEAPWIKMTEEKKLVKKLVSKKI